MKAESHRRAPKQIMLSLILVGLVMAMTALIGVMQLQAASTTISNAAFPAQQDAYVRSTSPDSNLGAGPIGVEPNTRGYVQFDISALPPGATILEARLRMKPSSFAGAPPMTVGLGKVDAAWNEGDVTWNTRPGVTAGGPTTSVANLDWVSWDVTSLVQAWYVDPTTNYGFVLGTQDPGVFFHSKEDGPAPQLLVRFEVENDPRPRPDLGDAPDSSNHPGLPSPAYAGPVAGQFPTVWDGPQPSGPRHLNQTSEMFLGNYISPEAEADQGPDADGPNNLQANGGVLIPNRDRADDGWLNRNAPFPNCRRTALTVRVSRALTPTVDTAYLNVFFDGNRDGDWADVGGCENPDTGQQSRSYEWIVQNFAIDMTAIPAGGYRDITVNSILVHNTAPDRPHWVRFMLSEAPAPEDPTINRADGRGPAAPNAFAFGETEDYFYEPQPQGEPGQLLIRKRVISETNPVEYAGTVTYQINVKHEGGTEPIAAEIRDLLTYPQHVIGAIQVTEVMTGVTPLFATTEYQRDDLYRVNTLIRWQGSLAPNAEIQISIPVHIHPLCQANQQTQEIVNTAQVRTPNGSPKQDSVTFQALCAGVDIDDIQVSQLLVTESDIPDLTGAAVELGNFEIQDFRKIPVRTIFTNTAVSPVTLGFYVEFDGIAPGAAGASTDAQKIRRTGTLSLEAGESASIDSLADLMKLLGTKLTEIPDDPAMDLEIQSTVKFAILPIDLADLPIDVLDPGLIGTKTDRFKVRPWDVGDAPDSTNHAGAAMTTYAGTPATFPTVFDPATGLPQGPAHARPRPFHLGQAVDLERDADLAPAPRNIVPPANIANQDAFDDGANPNAWALNNCRSTTVPVRVFISPAAVAWLTANNNGIGYLNGWIDSNRDASWDDAVECTNAEGQNSKWAPEHIIIDAPINVAALGAGLHTVTVNTGLVPWPAAQAESPAWVRLTLSERPSNKTLTTPDGTAHGDGRGYTAPFRTGETEDYLRRANLNGPDMGVDIRLGWQPIPQTEANAAATSLNFEEIKVTFRVGYANLGTQDATGVTLVATLPDAVLIGDEVLVEFGKQLGADQIQRAGNQVTVTLGTVPANTRGALLIEGKVPTSVLVNNEVIEGFMAKVTSDNDVNSENDEMTKSLKVALPTPRVGIKAPWSPFLASSGTTCSPTVEMVGTGVPNSDLVVALIPLHDDDHTDIHASAVVTHFRGPLTATVKVGPTGRWATTWSELGSGGYSGGVIGRGGFGRSAAIDQSTPKLSSVRFNVNTALRIDPMSLAFRAENGRVFTPNTLGWGREQWQVRLPNGTYTVGINVCSNTDKPQITVEIAGAGPVELTDADNDGRYEGQVTIGAPTARSEAATRNLSLTVVTNGEETVYAGSVEDATPGLVKDAVSGTALADATVTLIAGDNEDGVYSPWNGDAYGQSNPQTSAADGSYLFSAPTGDYFLTVTKDGYQTFRSDALAVTDLVNEVLELTPNVTAEADVIIAITESGFSPASIAVKPGTVVKFINTDVTARGVTSNVNWNGGILLSGESYTITVGDSGTILLTDSTNPTAGGLIVIDPQAGQSFIYLPAVQR